MNSKDEPMNPSLHSSSERVTLVLFCGIFLIIMTNSTFFPKKMKIFCHMKNGDQVDTEESTQEDAVTAATTATNHNHTFTEEPTIISFPWEPSPSSDSLSKQSQQDEDLESLKSNILSNTTASHATTRTHTMKENATDDQMQQLEFLSQMTFSSFQVACPCCK